MSSVTLDTLVEFVKLNVTHPETIEATVSQLADASIPRNLRDEIDAALRARFRMNSLRDRLEQYTLAQTPKKGRRVSFEGDLSITPTAFSSLKKQLAVYERFHSQIMAAIDAKTANHSDI